MSNVQAILLKTLWIGLVSQKRRNIIVKVSFFASHAIVYVGQKYGLQVHFARKSQRLADCVCGDLGYQGVGGRDEDGVGLAVAAALEEDPLLGWTDVCVQKQAAAQNAGRIHVLRDVSSRQYDRPGHA